MKSATSKLTLRVSFGFSTRLNWSTGATRESRDIKTDAAGFLERSMPFDRPVELEVDRLRVGILSLDTLKSGWGKLADSEGVRRDQRLRRLVKKPLLYA